MPVKGDKRSRTRARLLAAAAEVIAERGIERAALETIASRAGMTRGAIYGNFRSREELLVAAAATRWKPILPPPAIEGESLRGRMHRYGQTVATAAEERRADAVGATSFVQYALSHEPLRRSIERANADIYRAAAKRLVAAIPRAQLPMSPARFVRAVHALTEGVVILHALTPSLMTRGVIVSAFEALAGTER